MAGSVPGRIGHGTKCQDASYSGRNPLTQTTGKPVRLNPVVPPHSDEAGSFRKAEGEVWGQRAFRKGESYGSGFRAEGKERERESKQERQRGQRERAGEGDCPWPKPPKRSEATREKERKQRR